MVRGQSTVDGGICRGNKARMEGRTRSKVRSGWLRDAIRVDEGGGRLCRSITSRAASRAQTVLRAGEWPCGRDRVHASLCLLAGHWRAAHQSCSRRGRCCRSWKNAKCRKSNKAHTGRFVVDRGIGPGPIRTSDGSLHLCVHVMELSAPAPAPARLHLKSSYATRADRLDPASC